MTPNARNLNQDAASPRFVVPRSRGPGRVWWRDGGPPEGGTTNRDGPLLAPCRAPPHAVGLELGGILTDPLPCDAGSGLVAGKTFISSCTGSTCGGGGDRRISIPLVGARLLLPLPSTPTLVPCHDGLHRDTPMLTKYLDAADRRAGPGGEESGRRLMPPGRHWPGIAFANPAAGGYIQRRVGDAWLIAV